MVKLKLYQGLAILGLISCSFLSSCEDVIQVTLKDATPRLVVEGKISNLNDSIVISLHKSTDYFKPGNILAITDADVTISDSRGDNYSLLHSMNGNYSVKNISALPNDRFTLNIMVNGIFYSANSEMPALVSMDSVVIDKRPGHINENRINIFLKDPAGIENYYQVRVFRNDTLLNSNNYALFSDKYFDGKATAIIINARRFDIQRFEVDDTLKVQLINIDKMLYNYYQVLHDITDGGNILSASTPSNPPNNISNGALGYFTAVSISERTIIVR